MTDTGRHAWKHRQLKPVGRGDPTKCPEQGCGDSFPPYRRHFNCSEVVLRIWDRSSRQFFFGMLVLSGVDHCNVADRGID
jgi:hypothetical protein